MEGSMLDAVRRSALPGRSQSSHDKMARSLGYFSILGSHDPEPWIWTRVAGDLADIATVATGAQQDNQSKGRSALALATLAAVTLVDLACANGLNSEKGSRKTATRDYSRRSGYPQGLQAARGV